MTVSDITGAMLDDNRRVFRGQQFLGHSSTRPVIANAGLSVYMYLKDAL